MFHFHVCSYEPLLLLILIKFLHHAWNFSTLLDFKFTEPTNPINQHLHDFVSTSWMPRKTLRSRNYFIVPSRMICHTHGTD